MKKLWTTLLPLLWLPSTGYCSQWALLDPKGPIAADEKHLILTAFALMLIVVIPVIVMAFAFAWKYRAGNTSSTYAPKWDNSHTVEVVVWTGPAIIVLNLGTLVWRSTHALTPEKPIESSVKPLTVEVVAMNWKWLFIYPEQGVATVNRLVIPKDTPVAFRITSDPVMPSVFVPSLGGQIYAMSGMQTNLNLLADQTGTFRGLNTQFSGEGFAGMHFETEVTTAEDFANWIDVTKQGAGRLDKLSLTKLENPSENVQPIYFSSVEPGLFQTILSKYAPDTPDRVASRCVTPSNLIQAQR
jgi:cytochrome o ubiquinol oxidase subunit 2